MNEIVAIHRKKLSLPWLFAGFGVVLAGYCGVRAPTVLVARGAVSVFDAARSLGPLVFLSSGCNASRQTYSDWKEDPDFHEAVTPITTAPRPSQDASFEYEICDLVLTRLGERGLWWARLVERDVACASLWAGARKFADQKHLVFWPQFSSGDRMVRSLDPGELRSIGIVEVREDGRPRYRVSEPANE